MPNLHFISENKEKISFNLSEDLKSIYTINRFHELIVVFQLKNHKNHLEENRFIVGRISLHPINVLAHSA